MPEATQHGWRFYLGDMLNFTGKVLAYTRSMDQVAFIADQRT